MLRSVLILEAVCLGLAGFAGQVWADQPITNGPAVPAPPMAMPPAPTQQGAYQQPYYYYGYQPLLGNAPYPYPYAGSGQVPYTGFANTPFPRPLTNNDHVPYTGYGPLAGYYPHPLGTPAGGYGPMVQSPTGHPKSGLTTPPTDGPPRQKPLIKPVHTGPIISKLRSAVDIQERAPEGIPQPIGNSNLYTEFGFIFGSARAWFGTAESTYGQFRRTYILP